VRRTAWLGIATVAACAAGDRKDAVDGTDTDAPESDADTDTDTDTDCDAALAIGTGLSGFAPLSDGDTVRVVYGPQGGWHVDTAGSVSGLGEGVLVRGTLTDLRIDEPIAGLDETDATGVPLTEYDGCTGTFAGVRAVIDDYLPPEGTLFEYICGLDGAPLRLDLAVVTLATAPPLTAEAAASAEVVGLLDSYFATEFCSD